jgi:hypothetical protein
MVRCVGRARRAVLLDERGVGSGPVAERPGDHGVRRLRQDDPGALRTLAQRVAEAVVQDLRDGRPQRGHAVLGVTGAGVRGITEADRPEARLRPVHLDGRVDERVVRVLPRRGVALVERGEEALGESLRAPDRQRLDHGDAVREVPVDRADGRPRALGHHGGGQPLEPDLVDHGSRGVEESREARRTAGLDRLVPEQ